MIMKKKMTIVLMALALVLCFAIGGTLAWLVDKTDPVVNTFTYGDINIELWENDYDPESGTLDADETVAEQDDYKMVPGNTLPKNPTVTVKAGSEACWLFVKVEKTTNFDEFMTFEIADGWSPLEGVSGVYYREVVALTAEGATALNYKVLKEDKVVVKSDVKKETLNAFDKDKDGILEEEEKKALPSLTFTAYAVQKDSVADEATAWEYANAN